MEEKKIDSSTFYVDDITRELSRRYDLKAYVGCLHTLGEANTEIAMGRFLFLAKLAGEIVGVDFATYKQEFPNQQFYDYPRAVHDEEHLKIYAQRTERILGVPPLRNAEFMGKMIYFPTENLIKIMLRGSGYIPRLSPGIKP